MGTSRSTRRTATAARKADPQRYRDPSWFVEAAEIMRTAYEAHKDDNDFIQPGTLYRQVMSPTDRDHLVGNIVWHLSQGVERFIQERAVNDYWTQVDPDLGARVAERAGHWRRRRDRPGRRHPPHDPDTDQLMRQNTQRTTGSQASRNTAFCHEFNGVIQR